MTSVTLPVDLLNWLKWILHRGIEIDTFIVRDIVSSFLIMLDTQLKDRPLADLLREPLCSDYLVHLPEGLGQFLGRCA